jgi:hypothetical protein
MTTNGRIDFRLQITKLFYAGEFVRRYLNDVLDSTVFVGLPAVRDSHHDN